MSNQVQRLTNESSRRLQNGAISFLFYFVALTQTVNSHNSIWREQKCPFVYSFSGISKRNGSFNN